MKMGLIVNPIAGMGGRVGLKGTDGVLDKAIEKGATPVAPARATEFLSKLAERTANLRFEVLSCPGLMGATEAKMAGVPVQVLPMKIGKETSAQDTKEAIEFLVSAKVDLIVFVGGDGTAKNIFDAMSGNDQTPVLGVPSGVKMYSGIFAVNTSDAAEAVAAFAENSAELTNLEIMDADEEAIRSDVFSVKLYGYLKGLYVPMRLQGSKQVSPETVDEKENQDAIAGFVIEEMPPEGTFLLGPGTTVERIAERLGVKKTVLGVDIYEKGKITLDVDEKTILEQVKDWKNTWLIVSPIGSQGMLLGRGNQQVSPEVIKRLGKSHIIVVATRSKLESIEGQTLRIDTGDAETDDMLRGPIRIVTSYKEGVLVQIQ
jgi:predicted polyphosphate/ATP-dependent NAD kinase